MSIPSKCHGTYTSSVSNMTPNPSGTLVVPSPNSSDQVQYTVTGGTAQSVSCSVDSNDRISFSISFNGGSCSFSASSWGTSPTSNWEGSCWIPPNNPPSSSNWGAQKGVGRRREHERDVA
jgi:hypothetical protein